MSFIKARRLVGQCEDLHGCMGLEFRKFHISLFLYLRDALGPLSLHFYTYIISTSSICLRQALFDAEAILAFLGQTQGLALRT
jgi:hypothetical protein